MPFLGTYSCKLLYKYFIGGDADDIIFYEYLLELSFYIKIYDFFPLKAFIMAFPNFRYKFTINYNKLIALPINARVFSTENFKMKLLSSIMCL
jgi:hypothetical protein